MNKITKISFLAIMIAGILSPQAISSEINTNLNTVSHQVVPVCMQTDARHELRLTMQMLWSQHMEWTFAAIMAYVHYPDAFDALANRLLKNQEDIGEAVKQFYGDAAGKELTKLLKEHIDAAVQIVIHAKAGHPDEVNKAVAIAYANAEKIADFLAGANPNWKKENLRLMMKTHIDTTVAYATSIIKGDFVKAIDEYDLAESHMRHFSEILSDGIIKQFPEKFK